jgi:hypothetical protein
LSKRYHLGNNSEIPFTFILGNEKFTIMISALGGDIVNPCGMARTTQEAHHYAHIYLGFG